MTPREKATDILASLGAILVRKKKHEIYRLSDGRIWARSKTPSDAHSDLNNLSALKKEFGIVEERQKNPERREKQPDHGGHGKRRGYIPVGGSLLADQLRATGLVEQQLRSQVARLENDLMQMTNSRDRFKALYCRLKAETDGSWVWRWRRWVRGKREG